MYNCTFSYTYASIIESLQGTFRSDIEFEPVYACPILLLAQTLPMYFWTLLEELFSSIGMPKVLDGIKEQKASNQSVRTRLNEFVKLRNTIARGDDESVTKARVNYYRRFTEVFAKNLDRKMGDEIKAITRVDSW